MSRHYEVEVHVKYQEGDKPIDRKVLDKWGMSIESTNDYSDYELGDYFFGYITLGGGHTEYDAHDQLKKLISYPITTKWLCQDFDEWDEVIEDED